MQTAILLLIARLSSEQATLPVAGIIMHGQGTADSAVTPFTPPLLPTMLGYSVTDCLVPFISWFTGLCYSAMVERAGETPLCTDHTVRYPYTI